MDALLFAVVLEVALLQMKILETGAARKISCDSHKPGVAKRVRSKLHVDRKIVIDLFKRSLIELVENGEWCSIKHTVDSFQNNQVFLEVLKSRNDALKSSLKNINAESQRQLHNNTIELENSNKNISLLRDRLKWEDITERCIAEYCAGKILSDLDDLYKRVQRDCVYNTTLQLKYADKYLTARTESLKMKLDIPPMAVPRADREQCVHSQLLRLYEIQFKETEDSLDYWQSRYIEDLATIKERLKEQTEKYHNTAARRKELEDLYALHQGEMRGWLNFKKERAARLAREERAKIAAIRIQAWWRGLMVRRCLGAYRFLRNSKKATPKPKKK